VLEKTLDKKREKNHQQKEKKNVEGQGGEKNVKKPRCQGMGQTGGVSLQRGKA